MSVEVPKIVVLAAGDGGTTAEAVFEAIQNGELDAVVTDVVYTNPRKSPDDQNHIVTRVEQHNQRYAAAGRFAGHVIKTHLINNSTHPEGPAGPGEITDGVSKAISQIMVDSGAAVGALLGYRKKVRGELLRRWKGRLTNNHPGRTDLEEFRGLYGMAVHEMAYNLARQGKITYTGFTMHLVEEEYDVGERIGSVPVLIGDEDTQETIATNVRATERKHTARILGRFLARLAPAH